MNKKKVTAVKAKESAFLGVAAFVFTLSFLFLTSFAVASFVGYAGSSDDSASTNITTINEDTVTLLEFTVNQSDTTGDLQYNISSVNITFPSSFTLHEGSNITGIDGILGNSSATFSSTVLSWFNGSCGTTNAGLHCGLINASPTFGGFVNVNLTAAAPGKYNISILVGNDTAEYGDELNLTLHVNDTTAPHAVTFMPIVTSSENLSISEIIINVSVNDTHSPIGSANISIYLTNDSYTADNGARNSSIIYAGGALNDTLWVNFSGAHLVEGNYILNVTAVNDNSDIGNLGVNTTNATGAQFNFTIDKTAPGVALAKNGDSTSKKLVLDVTVTDTLTGNTGLTCSVSGGGTNQGSTITGDGGSQTVTQEGLSCSSSYTYTVTCADHAGNTGVKEASFKTDACSGGGGGSSGGSSSSGTTWSNTFVDSSTDLEDQSVSRELASNQRTRIKVSGSTHHVGVKSLTDTTATIEIASDPQEATLSVGETRKFDLESDDTYDLSVTLNSITSGKADLTIVSIDEPVTEEVEEQQEEAQQAAEEEAGIAPPADDSSGLGATAWTIIVIVIVIIIAAVVMRANRR